METALNPEPTLTQTATPRVKLRMEQVVKTFNTATQTVEAFNP